MRGIPIRAILVPVGVAILAIAALSWYGLSWIPAQQRYLHERNSRLLRTIASQVRSKIDNFDQSVDHALESFQIANDQDVATLSKFNRYVKLFAPALEILDGSSEGAIVEFDDPPRIKVRLDEGRHFLYLGFRHWRNRDGHAVAVRVQAKADIDRIVGDYLASRSEFDAIALVDRDGHVIAQRSSSGVELARVDPATRTPLAAAAGASTQGAASSATETRRPSGSVPDVTIGGDTYKFYEQPVQLSLLTPDGKEAEEWRLCGLVRLDRFRAASSAISSTYWLTLIAALAVLCLVMPLLKLHILQPRERFRRNDGVSLAIATYLIAGLVTFALLDAFYYGYAFKRQVDRDLRDLAGAITESFRSESQAAMTELESQTRALTEQLRGLKPTKRANGARITLDAALRPVCDPAWACGQGLLASAKSFDQAAFRYPYFDLVVWSDRDGNQLIKWSTGKGVTPFLNIQEANLGYYADLQRARRLGPVAPQTGVTVIQSPNTGNPLTVFWKALPGGGEPDLAAVSVATTPLSLVDPLLPQNMRFAVIDRSGRVLFHSDANRRLNESFFQECEDDAALRAAVVGGASDTLTVQYLGRRHRLHVTPLEVGAAFQSFSDPRWSLMVFQDALVMETANLETLTEAVALFVAFGLVLAAGWALACLIWPAYAVKWFWPNELKAGRYRSAAIANGALAIVFLGLIARADPPWLLLGAFLIAVAAASATFAIVRFSRWSPSVSGPWHQDFLLARTSLLFAVAAVPAIACFQAAYDFETNLLVRRGALHLANAFDARTERVRTVAQTLPLCPDDQQTCPHITAFVDRRIGESSWDVHLLSFARLPAGDMNATLQEATWLDRIVGAMHLPYNDVAVDSQAALPAPPVEGKTSALWSWSRDQAGRITFTKGEIVLASMATQVIHAGLMYWLLAIVIAVCLYLLVRFIVPFFLLDLYVPPGLKSLGNRELNGNLLLIGPPGSGKTYALRKTPGSRIFDVRTLAYTEPNPGTATGPARLETLEDALNPLAMLDGGVLGIDHLEYRLDDPAFRDRVLKFLEKMIYGRHYRVWIASTREPVDQIQDTGAPVDLDAWRRLFQPFHKEAVGIAIDSLLPQMEGVANLIKERQASRCVDLEALILAECSFSPQLLSIAEEVVRDLPTGTSPTREDVLFEIGIAAEPFYRAIWTSCSKAERIVLRQLAEEEVVNPRNPAVVAGLMRSGLIRRDPLFCLMNETFRRFVLHELSPETLVEWEHQGVPLPWASVTTTMATVALGIGGVLVLTQQQLIDAWVGYVPALAPAVPTVWKLITSASQPSKPGTNT